MRERHEGTRKWRLPNCALHRRSHALPASRVPPSRGPCIVPTPTPSRRPKRHLGTLVAGRGRPSAAESAPPSLPAPMFLRAPRPALVSRTSQPKRAPLPPRPLALSAVFASVRARRALGAARAARREATHEWQGSVALVVAYHEAATNFNEITEPKISISSR